MIVVIQFRTDKSAQHEQDCFNKYLRHEVIDFFSVFSEQVDMNNPKKFLKPYKKIIFAGSGEFLLTRDDETERFIQKKLKPLLDYIVKNDFPTLAVCFGHQLMGVTQGGKLERDVDQAEAGIQSLHFTEAGYADRLFADLPNTIYAAMGHEDSLVQLPKNAVHLMYSEKCNLQSYRIGKNVYGVQFHPELDDNDLYERLSLYEHYDAYELGHDIQERVHGPEILRRFAELNS